MEPSLIVEISAQHLELDEMHMDGMSVFRQSVGVKLSDLLFRYLSGG